HLEGRRRVPGHPPGRPLGGLSRMRGSLDTSPIIPCLPLKKALSESPGMAQRIVDVLVPVALDHTYSYRAPLELDLAVGDIVAVPLGHAATVAVVCADNVAVRAGQHSRLKHRHAQLGHPPPP